jgi:hypothetical protein
MSSTTNVQNLFTNVFRPAYVYDAATSNYMVRLVLSNIDSYIGNTVTVSNVNVSDSNFNVYVGTGSGNVYSNTAGSFRNTAVGYQSAGLNTRVVDSVILGYGAGQSITDASYNVLVGSSTRGGGQSNIYIGYSTGIAGPAVGNIFLGTQLDASSTVSNTLRIGNTSNIVIQANMSNKLVGINTTNPLANFDVSGLALFENKVGIQWASSNDITKSLDVNGQVRSTGGYLSDQGTTVVGGSAKTTIASSLKRGMILVSAVDTGSSANRAARHVLAWTTSNATNVGSDISAGTTSIDISTGIAISNSGGSAATYAWNVTYFPIDSN